MTGLLEFDQLGDRILRLRLHDDRGSLGQAVERVGLVRVSRPQRQVAARQPLDARRILQRCPFRTQRRNAVALALDITAHLGDALRPQVLDDLVRSTPELARDYGRQIEHLRQSAADALGIRLADLTRYLSR